MTKKIALIAALLAAIACVGAYAAPAAHAGCQALAGPPGWNSIGVYVTPQGSIDCTTNNGHHYQLRLYLQGYLNGNWNSVDLSNPGVQDFYDPPSNFSYSFYTIRSCVTYMQQRTAMRSKAVVENMGTGTKDTYFSYAVVVPTACRNAT